ncbi:MAG: MBOAT family protein [Leptolyngbya sp. SIO4C1]|nr:MBOAT family protein [Leptolyngbya sp. SIO4C1]
MVFTEFRFLLFFAIVFGVYWSLPRNRWRKVFILLCSYAFYGFWDWRFLSLLIGSTLIDYFVSLRIADTEQPTAKRNWLLISLVANLGALGFFKYFNFFTGSAVGFFDWLGLPVNSVTLNVVLPVGISFFTFQTLSYTLDVYFGQLPPERNMLNLACFIAFFPQLVAGPIVRAADFLPQLQSMRLFSQVNVRACLLLFIVGFFKKACVSDNLAPLVDTYFAAPENFTALSAWIGVLSYAVQIYCDFSGYSDMAIAVAGLLGYELCLNFDAPYFASSITDFWRRWHISLSTWLKDYLYIPLGGNRGGKLLTYRNLMLTMLLGGLWHGAAWTFVIWGGMHGGALIAHREWAKWAKRTQNVGWLAGTSAFWGMALTFYWVCFTWIFFRAADFGTAATVVKSFVLLQSPGVEQLNVALLGVFVVLAGLHWVFYQPAWKLSLMRLPGQLFAVGYGFAIAALLTIMPTSYAPFIYFQF